MQVLSVTTQVPVLHSFPGELIQVASDGESFLFYWTSNTCQNSDHWEQLLIFKRKTHYRSVSSTE